MAQWMLDPQNANALMGYAAFIVCAPLIVIFFACMNHIMRPPKPDDHDDPATWGDQPGPRQ